MILPDTSFWIEYFKTGSKIKIEKYSKPEELWTALPIIQEILQGIKEDKNYDVIRTSILSLNIAEPALSIIIYEDAAGIFRIGRKKGVTIRSSITCLISAIAIRNSLTVLHRDRDFTQIAKYTNLKQKQF